MLRNVFAIWLTSFFFDSQGVILLLVRKPLQVTSKETHLKQKHYKEKDKKHEEFKINK